MTLIRGEEELSVFRARWTGERVLELLKQHGGRLLITWPIGVGKSRNIDDLTETSARSGSYDLVLALFPTRRILEERRWIQNPPDDVPIVNLRPRPRQRCLEP